MVSLQKLRRSFVIFVTILFVAIIILKFQRQEFVEKIKFKLIGAYDHMMTLKDNLNIAITSIKKKIILPFEKDLPKNTINLSKEITILTAYFNIGTFGKGSPGNKRGPSAYYKWMSVFANITNNLIVYTDDETTYKSFQKMRSRFSKEQTKLFLIDTKTLWTFQIKKNISDIFSQPGYPKHHPNTVLPEYACVVHAKFELLNRIIRKNYFHTKYFMWLDMGYFRSPHYSSEMRLAIPKDFNDSSVAYSQIGSFNKNVTYKNIVYSNMVWLAGGCNLGKYDVLYKFTQEYLNFVKKSLSLKLISTEQQIIYGMYVDKEKPKTQLQLYKSGWFKLGTVCYEAGKKST